MKITFTRPEKDFIEEVAKFRTIANEGKKDNPSYNRKKMKFNDECGDLVSVATEAAVVKACGYDLMNVTHEVWNHFYLPSHRGLYGGFADVTHEGRRFEVRRVNRIDNGLIIRTKDLVEGQANVKTFMDVDADSNGEITRMAGYVEIIGWIDSHEGWKVGRIPNFNGYPDRDAREVFDQYLNTNFEEVLLAV